MWVSRIKLGCQAWQQAPLPAEPAHRPKNLPHKYCVIEGLAIYRTKEQQTLVLKHQLEVVAHVLHKHNEA